MASPSRCSRRWTSAPASSSECRGSLPSGAPRPPGAWRRPIARAPRRICTSTKSTSTTAFPAGATIPTKATRAAVPAWSSATGSPIRGPPGAASNGRPLPRRGFRRLVYVGLDMHPDDGRHAAGAGLHSSGFARSADRHRQVCEGWERFCGQAARRGIEVVNLTPLTALKTMPRAEVPVEWVLAS